MAEERKEFEQGLAGLEAGPSASDTGAPAGEAAAAGSHPTVSALRDRFGTSWMLLHERRSATYESI